MKYLVKKSDRTIKGLIHLSGSKSISNRVLLIEALCEKFFDKENISDSSDTGTLQNLLQTISLNQEQSQILDCHDAGTTFRFLTALCALKKGEWILTGSERMKQRPIGDLVAALRTLGAEVIFMEQENFPPIKVIGGKLKENYVQVKSNISSQYVSALLLIGPCLKNGLTIELVNEIVSQPYIDMTLSVMKYFGVAYDRFENKIFIPHQKYQSKSIFIESDWSAAAFYYEMAAFASELELELSGLSTKSIQGDAALSSLYKNFGVGTEEGLKSILISSIDKSPTHRFNLKDFPDLAPAMFATAGGLSLVSSFEGISHLAYKESNRGHAMMIELAKCGISVSEKNETISVSGKFIKGKHEFETYKDHRIAMALAPLAILCGEVMIDDPAVVNKSYPNFWEHLKLLGFEVDEVG